MEARVPSLDQLRRNAAECIRLAEEARTLAHRSFFLEMADRWLTLAEHVKKTQDGYKVRANGAIAESENEMSSSIH